jgi:hypothetical protein
MHNNESIAFDVSVLKYVALQNATFLLAGEALARNNIRQSGSAFQLINLTYWLSMGLLAKSCHVYPRYRTRIPMTVPGLIFG